MLTTIDDIQWLGIGFVGLYLLLAEILRFQFVGRPARALLDAEVEGVRQTARRLQLDDGDPVFRMLDSAGGHGAGRGFPWVWTGGREVAAWRLVHRAELLLIGSDQADLSATLDAVQEDEERQFERLVSRNRLGAVLGMVGLVFVGGVVLIGPAFVPVVFVGAIGGFLSGLRRALRSWTVSGDEGARWASMILAPVIGALTAFAGITLLQLLTGLGILSLPAALVLANPPGASILGLALLFGFAEPLFVGPLQGPTESGRTDVAAVGRRASRAAILARLDDASSRVMVSAASPAAVEAAPAVAPAVKPAAVEPANDVAWPNVSPSSAPVSSNGATPAREEAPPAWPSVPTGPASPAVEAVPAPTSDIAWPYVPPAPSAPPAAPAEPAAAPTADIAWPDVPPAPLASPVPPALAEPAAAPTADISWTFVPPLPPAAAPVADIVWPNIPSSPAGPAPVTPAEPAKEAARVDWP